MTDHKPFTAEQLDRIETASFLAHSSEEHEVMLRLLAQAREEIRLREGGAFRAGYEHAIAFLRRDWPTYQEPVLLVQAADLLAAFNPTEDPSARAKRELGEWLVAAESERGWRKWYENEVHIVDLYENGRVAGHAQNIGSLHEAITAALRAASGEKP